MLEAAWNTRSAESKDLINKMMTFKYDDRITADSALQHPWFKLKLPESTHIDMQSIQNLHNFRVIHHTHS